MGKDLPAHGDGDDRVVRLGSDQAVSMQLLQNVYNELTGKTEKLAKSF